MFDETAARRATFAATALLILGLAAVVSAQPVAGHGDPGDGGHGTAEAAPTSASEAVVAWQDTYGGEGTDRSRAVTTAHGGGYVVGVTAANDSGDDADVAAVRYDEDGERVGETVLPGPRDGHVTGIARTDDGYVLSGYSAPTGENGSVDGVLVKLDRDLGVEWRRTFGGDGNDYGCWVATAPNGDVVVAAFSNSAPSDDMDGLAIRYAPDGTRRWTERYDLGGRDYLERVVVGPNGELLFAGHTTATDAGHDAWVLVTDGRGDELWNTTYGGPGPDFAWHVTHGEGSMTVSGTYTGEDGATNPYLRRLGPDGETRWMRSYDSTGETAHVHLRTGDGYVLASNGLKENASDSHGVQMIATDGDGEELGRATVGDGNRDAFWHGVAGGDRLVFAGQRGTEDRGLQAWIAAFDGVGAALQRMNGTVASDDDDATEDDGNATTDPSTEDDSGDADTVAEQDGDEDDGSPVALPGFGALIAALAAAGAVAGRRRRG